MSLRKILFLSITFCLFVSLASANPVPKGSKLTISFAYKNNNNELRRKTSPSYAITKDGYAATIWVEGPYDPQTPCEIINFERRNIKLTRVITNMAFGKTRDQLGTIQNSFIYLDYNAPDFIAALIVSGMHHYCPYDTNFTIMEECNNSELSPVDSKRQDPTTGGLWTDVNSVVCYPINPNSWYQPISSANEIPDGITGATVYPESTVTYTWDMKDYSGNQIEEGHYLVYCQFGAERAPRNIEQDTIVNGSVVVGLETCWDDAVYDDLGHHRVVNLFHFTDSSFSTMDSRERKWSGDPFDYLDGPVSFNYTISNAITHGFFSHQKGSFTIYQFAVSNTHIFNLHLKHPVLVEHGPFTITIRDLQGIRITDLVMNTPSHSVSWNGKDNNNKPVAAGTYFASITLNGCSFSKLFTMLK